MTIKFSNFFRNPLVFELLYSSILPELIAEFRFLKVWSVGCANGEEPYSIAIMINELLKREKDFFDYKILGTDLDGGAIEKALKGEYHENDLLEVKKRYLDDFFQKISEPGETPHGHVHMFRISNEIKSMVKFACDDLIGALKTKKAFPDAYNLILCRNVLIYMNRSLQEEVLRSFSEKIYGNGYLVIGESETIPEAIKDKFSQIFPGVKIYKKLPASQL